MSRVLVTGANGFVGRALCRALVEEGHEVTGLVRRAGRCPEGAREWIHDSPDYIDLHAAWPAELVADCVVHLAARVHVMRDDAVDPLEAYRETNLRGTLRVAEAAHRHGVQRMVFVSSIKAIAELDEGRPLREDNPARPGEPYGRSKCEAEQALTELAGRTGLDTVIVRSPLVYGPGVGANFLSLMDAIVGGTPLPLGAINAKRSLIFVDNLADALVRCATDPRAAQACFHVSDGSDPTVSELIRTLGSHLKKRPLLFPVSPRLLRVVGRLSGRSAQIERLTGNLRVDISHIQAVLDWQPPYSLNDGLAATARWYLSTH